MIAKERGLGLGLSGMTLVVVSIIAAGAATAVAQDADPRYQVSPPTTRAVKPANKANARQKVHLSQIDVPPVKPAAIPVNPSDPIALVNGQVISRQQLADECVARKGKEILDLLINRTIIEQALRSKKLEITGAEIDQEIENTAQRFGISREGWLRTLDKDRGISPMQYARDIIYPALALRKLCAGRIQVTPKDMQDAFEAQFGDKLRCRMIMVDKGPTALEIWEELKKNPGGFEKLAQERSVDPGSRGLGGLLAEPITRHAYPQSVSDKAFEQLVDGDPKDRDPSHKPKNGDFTGPIQIGEMAYIILRRESIVPAVKTASLKDEQVRKQTYDMIYEVKLKETMNEVFAEYAKAAGVENKLTGAIKMANEEQDPEYKKAKGDIDGQVELMSNPPHTRSDVRDTGSSTPATGAPVARPKLPTPAALSSDAATQFDKLQRPLKSGTAGGGAGTAGTSSPN